MPREKYERDLEWKRRSFSIKDNEEKMPIIVSSAQHGRNGPTIKRENSLFVFRV